jgi:hypothetical protein
VPLTPESSGLEALCERVVARYRAVRSWDLAPPRDAEFLPQSVSVCLCRSRRDAEPLPDFFVRAAYCDQAYDFHLPPCEIWRS